jgi:hypothetical protein
MEGIKKGKKRRTNVHEKEGGSKWGYYDMSEGEERRGGNNFLTEGEEEGEEGREKEEEREITK